MARLTQEEFISRCNTRHSNRYMYHKTEFKTTRDKIIVTCPMHGDFSVIADNHMRTSGCPKCGTISGSKHTCISYDEFISRVNEIGVTHLVFNKEDYVNSRTPIHITCTRHNNTFIQKPFSIYQGHIGCKMCISEKISLKTRTKNTEFIHMCRSIYDDKFGYNYCNYTTNTDSVIITCNKHGEFLRQPKTFLRGYHCPSCMKEDIYLKNSHTFKEKFDESWPEYTLKSEYKGAFHPILVECKTHGDFEITPEQCRVRSEICEKCRCKNGSRQEQALFAFLDTHNIKYIPNYKVKTDNRYFEIDAYIPDSNIGIEINGLYWHREQEGTRYDKNYHINKTIDCENKNITLLHFYDIEIDNKFDIVKSIISSKLSINTNKIYARNTTVKYIQKNEKKQFLDKYHLQGNDKSSVYMGLFIEDELLCVMTFGNRKITGSRDHELMRFCVKSNTTIIGGFSKLLKRYRTDYNPPTIKTYADRRYSRGDVYTKNGFTFIRYSTPSYWYFAAADYKLTHRYSFTKHLLKKKVSIYDESLSEKDIMKLNNYHRIWDCGQCVYTL